MASPPVALDPTTATPTPTQPQPLPSTSTPIPTQPAIPVRQGPGSDADSISDYLKGRLSTPSIPTPPGASAVSTPASTPAAVPATPVPEGAPVVPIPTSPSSPTPFSEEDLREFNFDEDVDETKPGLIPTSTTPTPTETPTPSDEATQALARTLAEGGLPKEIESAFLATPRGKRMLDGFKVFRELESPPDPNDPNAGGIGFAPNADQIRDFYRAYSYWESLQDEFDSNPRNFVHNFFAPDPQTGQFRPGVPAIAQSFLQALEYYNPNGQLAQSAIAPVLNRPYVQIPVLQAQLNDLLSLADSVPPGQNPDNFGVDERSRILDAANILQSRIQSRFSRNGSPTALTTPTTRGGPDPLAQERAALAAERQALAQTNQQIVNNLATGFRNEVMSVLESTVQHDIDVLLTRGGVKQRLESLSPAQYNLYRDACVQEVYKGINGSPAEGKPPINPTALNSFDTAFNRATRSVVQSRQPLVPGSEGDRARAHAIQQYRQIGQTVIKSLGAKFIKDAGGQFLAQTTPSSSALARLTSAAGQRESPANSGPPVQHSLAPAVELPKPQPGQDPAEAIASYFSRKMTATAPR